MKNALWIAADLCAETPPRLLVGVVSFMMLILIPFQMGMMDGGLTRGGVVIFPQARTTLSMHGAWPVLAVLALVQNTIFSRRQRRELEPVLAAPVSGLSIVAGYALPVAAACIAGPLLMFPWMTLGYRLSGGSFLTAGDLGASCLLVWVAGAGLTGPGIAAALYARHTQSMFGLTALAYGGLVAIDGLMLALRALGLDALVVPGLLLSAGAGVAALGAVAARLDRERLIRRP